MDMVKCFLSTLLGVYGLTLLVNSQDQSGFISMDCGISENSGYTDETTGIDYISDETFIDTGTISSVSTEFKTNTLERQFLSLRSFPTGTRNCYNLTTPLTKGYKYLIRARFMYGSYDVKNKAPKFDLHLGVNFWDSVEFANVSTVVSKEIIHAPLSNNTHLCLVNTGFGTPFISAIELRLLPDTIYVTKSGSLALFRRYNFGSTTMNKIRFKDDKYDRIWSPLDWPKVAQLNTSGTVDGATDFQPPSSVMNTCVTPRNASGSLDFFWAPKDPTTQHYIYMHFAEFEKLQANQSREFNISLNEKFWFGPVVPDYLIANSIYSVNPKSGSELYFSLYKTNNSTLPPILNALEVYIVKELLQSQTDQVDVDAMMNIKSTYGLKRNWQGDPCAPKAYSWDGLNCIYVEHDPPTIISLNLSSSGLNGEISSYISNLISIKHLDLSNNNLTGPVPEFLAQLSFLKVLNLTGNKLTGSVPVELLEKSKNGLLSLSVAENLNLCSSVSCKKTKKKSIVVPIVASVAALCILVIAMLAILCILKRRKQPVSNVPANSNKRDLLLETENQFTYSEVLTITNNFERVIGKGGFGTVYHGYLSDTQVAVKMLSPSSTQGYKEFQAEVKLLLRVHHKNLTSLVGYCDEDDNMGLIYEYMANGNLEEHLSDKNQNVLSWEERLSIAMDAAQGLEYLHSGCKPPIVHRDVKSTNILLTEKFQAKVADFGLSRDFPVEGGTQISTLVAGTPGYLDPEYYISNRLNEKSDVFSFGVVLLEMITGQPAIARNDERTHISKWASFMLTTKGDVGNIVDPCLQGDYDTNSVWKALEVAMACVTATSIKRPTMNHTVMQLKQCLAEEIARKETDSASKYSIEMVPVHMDSGLSPLAR